MVRQLLTFALSVVFFIWLPNAFADGSGVLSLDAPPSIRQTQTQGDNNALLTLRVDNIQVRAEWRVTSAVRVFDIADGVLQTVTTIVAPVTHVATIYVEDKFDLLNESYANLTASAVITVKFEPGAADKFGLNDAPRLTAVAGKAVSLHTFSAEGGSGDKTYTLVAGDDADYFDLDKNSGVLSLQASAQAGVYTLTVEVRNDAGDTDKALATVEVLASLSLATVPPLTVIVGRVAHTLVAGGGIGTHTYAIVSGNKDGFALDAASGVLSLSVNAGLGRHTLTVQVMDAHDNTAQAVVMVEVVAALSLSGAPSFTVIAGVGMNLHTLVASGGIGTPTYEIVSGDEDGHFDLGAASGVLSLQADAKPDTYVLSIQAMDARANTADTVVTVGVSAVLSLADARSFTVIASVAMSLHTFIASGGIGLRTYILLAGEEDYFSVGAGSGVLSLSMNAEVGRHTLTVQVMDERGNTDQALATVGVSAALVLLEVPSFTVIASVGMNLHTLVANGGIGTPTYAILDGNKAGHFDLDAASGVLSLSANANPDNYVLRIQAKDARDNTAQAMVTVGVSAVLSLADAPRLGGARGIEVSLHTFAAQGGIGARTYTLLTDDAEGYFSLDAESGVLSLLAVAPVAAYTLSVQVRDDRGHVAQALATVRVALLFLADAPPLYAVVGREVSLHTFDAKGVDGTLTYTIASGDDKDYFSLDAASGVLGVRATAAIGVYTLSVSAKDERSSAEALAVVEVRASLSLVAMPPLTVIVGRVAHTLMASGGIGKHTYAIESGDEGVFVLDAASGVLSLRADAALGRHTLTVQVADERKNTAETVATVEVSAVLELADAPSFTVIASVAMSLHTFIASGGIGTPTYTILAGNEVEHFDLDAASGVLSLSMNAEVGRHTLTVQVMDGRGNTAQALATVGVSAVLELADAPSFTVIASVAMSLHTFIASGGIGTPTYTILAGNEVEHFDLDAASGVLSLSMNADVGRYTLTVQVMDGRDNIAEAVATVGVSAALELAAAPSFTVIASVAMSLHTFIASGGIGTPTYTILAGDEDGHFDLGTASGVLSLAADAKPDTYVLSIQAKDARNNAVKIMATVGVSAVLALTATPSFTVIASAAMSLHMFIAGGGIGSRTYTLLAGDERYFSVGANSGVLSLSVDAAVGSHTLTVQVMDERDNTAQAVATVGVSAVLALADAPSFTVIASAAMSLHTFIAGGGIGSRTYTLLAGDERYFSVGADSGVLSLSVDAAVGSHTLTVQVMDERDNIAQAVATVEVSAVLALADAPSFTVIASVAMSLHTFIAGGGIGSRTYTLLAGDERYFSVGADSGVLSLSVDAAVGSHTLTVQVMDERGNTAQALATVGVSAALALADAPSFTVIASVAMSLHTFIASGGIGTPTYTIVAGNDDGYFALNAASGVLSLTVDTAVGSHTLTVQVMDERGNTAQALATVGVSAALALAGAPSFTVIASVAMSLHTFIASGGVGIKTYTLVAGDAEEYFAVDAASGVFSLSVNAPLREYTLTVQAMDERANTVETVVTVGVSAVLALVDAPLLRTVVGEAGNLHTFAATGGIGDKTYTIAAGNEDYFSLDRSSGVLSMEVTVSAGIYTLSVQAADADGNAVLALATVKVVSLLLRDVMLYAVVGREVSLHTFEADGGEGAKTYTIVAGNEAKYFTLDANSGVLSVTAKVSVGVYTLLVEVSDESGNQVAAVATVEAVPMLSLVDAPLLSVVAGKALELHTFTAAGGIKAKTYSLVDAQGYFTLGASSGILSVQAVSEVGIYTVSVEVSDSAGNQATAQATVGVIARLSLVGASLMAVEKKAVSLHTFAASGGIGARTYTLSAGNETGYFVLDAASGVLSLSASASAGEYTLTVGVKDERDNIAAAVATVNISAALSLAGAPLLFAAEGEAKNLHTFVASGGLGVKTYTLAAGAGYFTVGAASGVLSVDANAPVAIYTLSVQAADADGNVVEALATAQVVSLLLADVMLYAIVGREVSLHTFEADGGEGAKTYTIVAGNEDKYFRIDANSGVLSVQGSATVGVYTLSVAVDDAEGNRAEALALVAVEASLFLADAPPLTVMAGLAVSLHTFAASDGIGAKAYTIAAGNKAYFALNAASGVLSLRATAPEGFHTLTVQAADEYDNLVEAVATVDVSAALSLAEASLLEAAVGRTMSVHTFVASGGIGAKTYTLSADNGAGYFAINATSGVLSVVNATVGVYTLSVQVSDSRGSSVQARGAVQVLPPMSLADAPPLEALARLSVMVTVHTFVASDGIGSKRYTLIADQSGYFALDADSGKLLLPSNSAMLAGAYTLRVGVLDGLTPPQRATAVATVRILKNRMYVLGGNDGGNKNDVWWSADGESWNREPANAGWPKRSDHQAVVHNGRLYILGGGNGSFQNGSIRNDVWSSLDGKSWRQELANDNGFWSERQRHQSLSRDGQLYVLGGDSGNSNTDSGNEVWSSADSKIWAKTNAAWPKRQAFQAVVHNGRMYVLGGFRSDTDTGYANDVWSSADGVNWSFEGNAEWEKRTMHGAVSHQGRLYVIGGWDRDNNYRNDVWSSLDGKSWRQELANGNGFWSERRRHQSLSRDGLLYVMGGDNGSSSASYKKDVWSSADGKSWTKVSDAAWSARRSHQAVVFPPPLVLSGTSETITLTMQAAVALHTVSAQYGGGQYAYSLPPEIEGFSIDGAGVLSADGDAQGGVYEITVRVEDEEGSHAETIINIELRVLALADAPPLSVFAGAEAVSLHVFTAIYGIGKSTYNLVDDLGYFTLGTESGVLSLRATVPEGFYTLTVQVTDEDDNLAEAVAAVEVSVSLSLADAPSLEAVVGRTMSVHTFVASGGIGAKTYTLSADNGAGYFAINATSGVLSVANATVGVYTLSVQVSDSRGSSVQARGAVQVLPPMSLADAPPLEALARLSVMVTVHTFVASDGIGSKRYTLIADQSGYFALDADSGKLLLPSNSAMLAGDYTLRVGVLDGLTPPQRATAVATVRILKNGIFVLGGNDGGNKNDVWWSADGETWNREPANAGWPNRSDHQAVVHNGRLYILGGGKGDFLNSSSNRNDVWSSLDGKSWRQELANDNDFWSRRQRHQSLSHDGQLYVLGGDTGNSNKDSGNEVWSSADSKIWAKTNAAWSRRQAFQAVVHNGRMYVLGGFSSDTSYENDVWSSADGVNWSFEGYAEWPKRMMHGAVSHQGRLYILGGFNGGNNYRNDVWSSLDGKSWRQELANGNGFWSERRRHQSLSRDGLLYVMGGDNGSGSASYKKDVWSSADGKSWTKVSDAAWSARRSHQAVVFPPPLVLLGTSETITLTMQAAVALHTVSAQYGGGQYAYSLPPEIEGFSIDGAGVLSADGDAQGGVYEITVRVEDEEGSHAETIINIELRVLALADAPPLSVFAGAESVSLHVFTAIYGVGKSTYNLVDDLGYFTLGSESGVLSLRATVPEGFYTLTVQVTDEDDNLAEAVAAVDVSVSLSLADAPSLEAVVGRTMSVHTFVASGGVGAKTYTLVADNGAGYFAINATSGVLSVANATVGVYILSVQVSDSRGSSVQARGAVQVLPPMSLADAPLLEALARLSVTVALHTFAASDGIGSKRYTVLAGNDAGYFALDADSGELLLPSNSAMLAGDYTLRVGVLDGLTPPQRATAVATVRIIKNGIFVISGNVKGFGYLLSDVWRSVDGEAWKQETANAGWTARGDYQAAVYQGQLYMLGGQSLGGRLKDVHRLADGKTWVSEGNAAWSKRDQHQAVVHNGRLYVLGGSDGDNSRNDVWSWAKGQSWRKDKANNTSGWTKRQGHQAVVHNGRLYVLGGQDSSGYVNDVWSSADGANWSFEGNAEWPGRSLYEAVSHQGRLYIMGGDDGSTKRNDVWSSLDGKSWRQELANDNDFWSKRDRFGALSRDGLLYVLGGNDDSLLNDVWSSADGKIWAKASDADWDAREGFQAVVFPSPLVLSGTSETIILTVQAAAMALHTVSAQYGGGQYSYSRMPEIEGIDIDGAGVLSADNRAQAGGYEITVRVVDEEGSHAETIINIELRVLALADAPPLFCHCRLIGVGEFACFHRDSRDWSAYL